MSPDPSSQPWILTGGRGLRDQAGVKRRQGPRSTAGDVRPTPATATFTRETMPETNWDSWLDEAQAAYEASLEPCAECSGLGVVHGDLGGEWPCASCSRELGGGDA